MIRKAHLKVLLLSHTPDPEGTVAAAARLCYSSSDVESVIAGVSREDQGRFMDRLVAVGHLSPMEHATFSFAIEGISRACSHQLVRHRLASYSQQSQRYVSETDGFSYVIPPAIESDKELNGQFIACMDKIQEAYDLFVSCLNAKGITGESAYEDARFVLPNAAETKIIVTMNARELRHFFSQRCCNRAQWEIRAMAIAMLRLTKEVAPAIFADAGPPCLIGVCPEGSFSCGMSDEAREYFRHLS
jgi:thymidylate synthase (FAD)